MLSLLRNTPAAGRELNPNLNTFEFIKSKSLMTAL